MSFFIKLATSIFFISVIGFFFSIGSSNQLSAVTSLPDQLYANTSPWNDPIGTNVQLDPNSAAMVHAVASTVYPTTYSYGMPIYISTASDPAYTVHTGNTLFNQQQPIHIPNVAAPSPGTDHWMFIYDTTKNLLFEMWEANKSGNTWSANTGDVYSTNGDGVKQIDGSPQSGNGGSYFGGVVSAQDAKHGYINHALSLAGQATWANHGRYPMNSQTDGGSGVVPMGARFQLDPSVNCDGLQGATKGEIMICHAMQTYGGYMHDSGGVPMSIYFEGEDLTDPNRKPPTLPGDPGRNAGIWGSIGLYDNQPLTHIPWNQMRVLKTWNSYTQVNNTVTPIVSGTPPIPSSDSSVVIVTVCLHGIGNCGDNANPNGIGNTTPKHTNRNITITILDANNQPVTTQAGNLSYDQSKENFQGTISMLKSLSGNYLIKIQTDGFLPKQAPGFISFASGKQIQLPALSLVNGDINSDGQVDILDYNILIGCFNSKENTSLCKSPPTASISGADLDDDGVIGGSDYNLFLRELSVQKGI